MVALATTLVILRDERHVDPARAQLYFYNMASGAETELKTANGKTGVLDRIAFGTSTQVAVNAVTVTLAAYRSGVKLGGDLELRMTRGSSYSFFLADGPSGPRTFAVTASVEKE
ncbi:MAG: hypothetical protein E4H20_10145 [Spirochaetales bacterium]|nr:MAG: hypothetical protein E4H20_10145 [Spirochaetales bacterium]